MLQYPATALCTELWKAVGDTPFGSRTSCAHRLCRLPVSPPDEANTHARSAKGALAEAFAETLATALAGAPAAALAGTVAGTSKQSSTARNAS